MGGTIDLVVVVVQTGYMGTAELDHLAGWATDTATNIQNLHAISETDLQGEVVLVAGDGLVEGLAIGEAAEVEGRTPAVLIEVGC
jgi:alpha-D-ribose 1-methylphosphonate 5-phosphate C-P lyase